jgi:transposase
MAGIGYKSKTDAIDARGLSRMGAEQSLNKWKPVSKYIYDVRSALRYREELTVTLTRLRNQRHAQDHMQYPTAEVRSSQEKLIKIIKAEIKSIEQKISQLVGKDKEFKEKIMRIVKSLNGVGFLTVTTLVAETNGFELFKNNRQITSYAGYDVVENQNVKARE